MLVFVPLGNHCSNSRLSTTDSIARVLDDVNVSGNVARAHCGVSACSFIEVVVVAFSRSMSPALLETAGVDNHYGRSLFTTMNRTQYYGNP